MPLTRNHSIRSVFALKFMDNMFNYGQQLYGTEQIKGIFESQLVDY
ncbi:hypothetical protein SAMN05518672_1011143 [Chitinophaga sp. CF118]|nr:hypothetical protein SAMN05518672_1011143 [Chitinophaga sp. CF118]